MLNATPEHQADINNAAEPSGVTPAVAAQSGVAAPPLGQTPTAPAVEAINPQEPPGPVPYERFNQVNSALNDSQTQNAMLNQQLALYQANMGQASPSLAQEPSKSGLDLIAEKFGKLDPADGIVGEEAVEMVAAIKSALEDVQVQAAQSTFFAQNPDYGQVVGTETQIAAPLLHILNQNPMVRDSILQSPNPHQAALIYGRLGLQQMQQSQQLQPGNQGTPPSMPIAGAPGLGNMTPVMAGTGPASISNLSNGTGLGNHHQFSPERMSNKEIMDYRARMQMT